jgi:hypothetical protein
MFISHFLLNLRGVNGDNNHATIAFTSVHISCPPFHSVVDITDDLGQESCVVYHAHLQEQSLIHATRGSPHR